MIRLLYIFILCVLIRGIKTVQNISQNSGHRNLGAFLVGIDAIFVLLVFQDVITNTITFPVLATVAVGYIVGYLLGTYVEEKIALGKVIVTIKTSKNEAKDLAILLKNDGFIFIQSKRFYSHKGKLKKIFQGVIFRRELPKLKNITSELNIIGTVSPVKSTFGTKLINSKDILELETE